MNDEGMTEKEINQFVVYTKSDPEWWKRSHDKEYQITKQ
jgi:hypothetical protein